MAKETVIDFETVKVEQDVHRCDTCVRKKDKIELNDVLVNPEVALIDIYAGGFNRNTVTSPADVFRMVEIDADHEYDVCLSCLDQSAENAIQGASRPVETTDEDERPTFIEWASGWYDTYVTNDLGQFRPWVVGVIFFLFANAVYLLLTL